MNTVGKILVILNLLFALAVGGFLVVDFATRTNWKAAYDKLQKEMEIAGLNQKAGVLTLSQLSKQAKDIQQARDKAEQDWNLERTMLKTERDTYKGQLEDEKDKAKAADLNHQKVLGELDAVKGELKNQQLVIQKREKYILDMEDQVRKFRGEAVAFENMFKSSQSRNESLLNLYQDLQRQMNQMKAGPAAGTKDPNAPNPPTVYVKGVVEKVHATDRKLVQISVGTDHGLKLHNTLEVYRMSPTPQYLGMIRIVETDHRQALGRYISTGLSTPRNLQEGDIVASSLGSQ